MGPNVERSPLLEALPFRLLQTHPTGWTPDQAVVTLNARMDARLVPSPASSDGTSIMVPRLETMLPSEQAFLSVDVQAQACAWPMRTSSSWTACLARLSAPLCWIS